MTNKKSSKRALLLSALSLLMCVSMLIGSTFAWFTDEVKSGVNKIEAGNLDIELYHGKVEEPTTAKVEGATDIFTDKGNAAIVWEPGVVAWTNLNVVNEGSLALKYQIAINFTNENYIKENGAKLSEVLKVAFLDNAITETDREKVLELAKDKGVLLKDLMKSGELLEKGANKIYGVVIYWEPSANDNNWNVYNGRTTSDGKLLHIDLGITLVATQLEAEFDSFGNDYDGDALYCDILATPETIDEILATAAPGTVIGLAAGEYGTITLTQNNLTLVSNAAVVGCLVLNEKDSITVDGLTFNAANAQPAYDASGKASGYVANLTDGYANNGGSVGVTVKNCTFIGVAADTDKYIPVYFGDGSRSNRSDDLSFENCEFKTNAKQYIALNGITNNSGKTTGKVVIKNNIFGGNGFGTTHNNINATSSGVNWTITGNAFNNWNPENAAIGSSRSSTSDILTWIVTGNEFNNTEDAVVLALKVREATRQDSYKDENTVVVFENNTALKGNGILVNATRSAKDDEDIYCGKKIQLNDNVVTVSDSEGFVNALKTLKNDSVVVLTNNVVVSSDWDNRYSGGKTTVPFEIDGMGNTIKITGTVSDGGNYHSVFRFETAATVKNLTFDLSEAGGYGGTRCRAISAKSDLTVENCTFIGNAALSNTRAISFGEGAGAAISELDVEISNCTFINWKRGITDNENGQDAKSVVIKDNTCTNAPIYVSAYENITVVNNTMSGAAINITSYSAAATAKVVATGNTLDASQNNVIGSASKLFGAANVTAQEGFVVNTIA